MIADDGPLDAPFDMGEYGQMDVADVIQSLFSALQGLVVARVETLASHGNPVGVKLSAAHGKPFYFWVDEDELHWGDGAALASHDWLDGTVPTASKLVKI